MDGTYGYDTLNATHHFMPDKMLLGTEVRDYLNYGAVELLLLSDCAVLCCTAVLY